jgi:hypothetical protein
MRATNSTLGRALQMLVFVLWAISSAFSQPVKIAPFKVNISPPIGSPAAYAPTRTIVDPLTARGLVMECQAGTIVLCAVDYIGIGNEGLDAWRTALAKAAGTSVELVNVHCLHQHDGVRCDLTVETILAEYGLGGTRFDVDYIYQSIRKVAKAVKKAKKRTEEVTHLGFGEAQVEKVASNRRILGPDGKVAIIRLSRTRDSAAIAAPEGVIDPMLKSVSFWQQDKPLAVLTYYATHPQSYYGQGDVNAEFVGMARQAREESLHNLPHIHFNGAGGNVAAGKYNDGSPERRPILAGRMELGMKLAWENTVKMPLQADQIKWKHTAVALPLASHLVEEELRGKLASDTMSRVKKLSEAKHLAWLLETKKGRKVDVAALQLGQIQLLHLPGELFVEYQLAAQALLPDQHICVAAYGDFGPGYIGTQISYSQGGYEVSPRATRVSPEVEEVLMAAIKKVLLE